MKNKTNTLIKAAAPNVESNHRHDFLQFISQIGFLENDNIKPLFLNFDQEMADNDGLKAIMFAGKGKMYSLEGNFIAAIHSFDIALDYSTKYNQILDDPYSDDIFAYVKCETGLFYQKINETDKANQLFRNSTLYAKNRRLREIIDYYQIISQLGIESNPKIDIIENLLVSFNKKGLTIIYSLGLFRLGAYYLKKGDFEKTKSYFDESLKLASENGYKYVISLVQHAICNIYILKKQYGLALQNLLELFNNTESHYLRSLVLETIAAAHYFQKDYPLAIDYCTRALNNSLHHNIISQIPGQCLFLGKCYHDNLKEMHKAKYFFKLGYDQSISQVEAGLSLTGKRLKAIHTYTDFLHTYYPDEPGSATAPDYLFEFTHGKPWQEIMYIFQYNLILHHRLKLGAGDEFLKILKLGKPTYYTTQNNLTKKGFLFPDFRQKNLQFPRTHLNESLQIYFSNLKDLSWEGAIKNFEGELLKYYFSKYGYKVKTISNVLNLSVASVYNKTKGLFKDDRQYLRISENYE
ncbi:MAG: hypothetical protein HQ510_06325 [Candidatus Marinimicrobia bacterium]|nr:hypothetical protein [Candidatus Neomarinimicrobiota bacterium]